MVFKPILKILVESTLSPTIMDCYHQQLILNHIGDVCWRSASIRDMYHQPQILNHIGDVCWRYA